MRDIADAFLNRFPPKRVNIRPPILEKWKESLTEILTEIEEKYRLAQPKNDILEEGEKIQRSIRRIPIEPEKYEGKK